MHRALALEDIWLHLLPYLTPGNLFSVVLTSHLVYELAIDGLWGNRTQLSQFTKLVGIPYRDAFKFTLDDGTLSRDSRQLVPNADLLISCKLGEYRWKLNSQVGPSRLIKGISVGCLCTDCPAPPPHKVLQDAPLRNWRRRTLSSPPSLDYSLPSIPLLPLYEQFRDGPKHTAHSLSQTRGHLHLGELSQL